MSEITAYREQIADMVTMYDAQLAETPDDKLYPVSYTHLTLPTNYSV